MGCAVGDYDNDADPDIYLTYWGPNQLLRNDGDGAFADVTAAAGTGDPGWGSPAPPSAISTTTGSSISTSSITSSSISRTLPPAAEGRRFKGLEVFYGPMGIPAQADRLYRNGGDAFVDVSAETGIAARALPGLGVALGDFDGDGDLDIYVANDSEPNQMYRNDGAWRFAETGTASRVAFTEDGRPQAGMGVHGGDYDNDGDLDLFVTNFSEDVNTLYRNDGGWLFADATSRAGLDGVVRPFLGFGTAFFDCDNDGWLDIFVANGHLYPQLERLSSGLRYRQRNLLYRNERGRFLEVGAAAGPACRLPRSAAPLPSATTTTTATSTCSSPTSTRSRPCCATTGATATAGSDSSSRGARATATPSGPRCGCRPALSCRCGRSTGGTASRRSTIPGSCSGWATRRSPPGWRSAGPPGKGRSSKTCPCAATPPSGKGWMDSSPGP